MEWLEVQAVSNKVAKIKIHGVIGGGFFEEGVTSQQVDSDLEEIKSIKSNVIEIDLDSGGGSVVHGLKIYNLLKENPAKIKIKGTGIVGSIATVIAAAADDNEFSMVNNSFYLIHEGRMGSRGTVSQLNSDAIMLGKINDTIAGIYSDKFKITKSKALALMGINNGEGEFLTAKEAKAKGYVDSIYKPTKGATASITEEDLIKYKIKAKINLKHENMKFNLKKITEAITGAYKAFVVASTDDEKKEDSFNEKAIEKSTAVVVESLQEQVDTFKESKEAELTAKSEEIKTLEATIVELKANVSDPSGNDANLEDDKKSANDIAAEVFVASLSDSDRMAFSANEK